MPQDINREYTIRTFACSLLGNKVPYGYDQLVHDLQRCGYAFVGEKDGNIDFITLGHKKVSIDEITSAIEDKKSDVGLDVVTFHDWDSVKDFYEKQTEVCLSAYGIYLNSETYAEKMNEMDMYSASETKNIELLNTIKSNISNCFNGVSFDSNHGEDFFGFLNRNAKGYTLDKCRTDYVLANVILDRKDFYHDDLISWANRKIKFISSLSDPDKLSKDTSLHRVVEGSYRDKSIIPVVFEGYVYEYQYKYDNYFKNMPEIKNVQKLRGPYYYGAYTMEQLDKFSDCPDNKIVEKVKFDDADVHDMKEKYKNAKIECGFVEYEHPLTKQQLERFNEEDISVLDSLPLISVNDNFMMSMGWNSEQDITQYVLDYVNMKIHDADKNEIEYTRDEITSLKDAIEFEETAREEILGDIAVDEDDYNHGIIGSRGSLEGHQKLLKACENEIDRLHNELLAATNKLDYLESPDERNNSYGINLEAVRCYGSCVTEGMFKVGDNPTPINVVVSFEGDMSEKEFNDFLNADKLSTKGIPIEIKTITPNETGTLGDFLGAEHEKMYQKELNHEYVKGTPVASYHPEKKPRITTQIKNHETDEIKEPNKNAKSASKDDINR